LRYTQVRVRVQPSALHICIFVDIAHYCCGCTGDVAAVPAILLLVLLLPLTGIINLNDAKVATD